MIHYIVMDLELNQDLPEQAPFRYEIIQIGAKKLDFDLNTIEIFNSLIKPAFSPVISPLVTELTGITADVLSSEKPFTDVFEAFTHLFDSDSVFCTWGMFDLKALYQMASFYQLKTDQLPSRYIDIQQYATAHFSLPSKAQIGLQHACERFEIATPYPFHNALYDAYYTTKILRRLDSSVLLSKKYDPTFQRTAERQAKQTIDFEQLFLQVEKMYERVLTEEEKGIIRLAYRMGRTRQFLR